jgi:hypothetical protein
MVLRKVKNDKLDSINIAKLELQSDLQADFLMLVKLFLKLRAFSEAITVCQTSVLPM